MFCVAGPLLVTRGTKDFAPALFGVACGLGSVGALAWTLATAARWIRVHSAFALLRTSASPLVSAPPLPPDVHGEIVADQGTNVICYAAASPTPFAGFGELVDDKVMVHLPLVLVPAYVEGAGTKDTHRVDATDMHLYLRNEMRRDSGVRDLTIVSNLFVRGDAANGVAGSVARRQGGPARSRQAHALIYSAGINDPGDRAQTYLTLQTVRHGGNLVISMHVRIREQHDRISLEIASAIAAPLSGKYTSVGGALPRSLGGLRAHARWYALMELPAALTEAWTGPLIRSVIRRLRQRARMDILRGIRSGRMPDRGARTSLRRWTMDRGEDPVPGGGGRSRHPAASAQGAVRPPGELLRDAQDLDRGADADPGERADRGDEVPRRGDRGARSPSAPTRSAEHRVLTRAVPARERSDTRTSRHPNRCRDRHVRSLPPA